AWAGLVMSVGWATLGMKMSLGPRLLKLETVLYAGPAVDVPRAATAITLKPAAGALTVLAPCEPSLPAANTTVRANGLPAAVAVDCTSAAMEREVSPPPGPGASGLRR